jgi:hypothetical protein
MSSERNLNFFLNNSIIIKDTSAKIKARKTVLKNLGSPVPWSKSRRKNKNTASMKKVKYAIPANAKMADTQKGIKSTDNNSMTTADIRRSIFLSYLEASFEARHV